MINEKRSRSEILSGGDMLRDSLVFREWSVDSER